ncbi:MAG: hypothetical protein E7D17_03340, partial [Citrobacter freundii]|nr:hypothetical protein [Citrobacter freundii]
RAGISLPEGIPAAADIVNLRYKSCSEMEGQDQLEHAGMIQDKKSLDSQLLHVLNGLSDAEKRQMIFDMLNKDKTTGGLK